MSDIPLLNKKVVVSKNDGFKKYGVLKSIDQQFLVLEFGNGKTEYIPVQAVGAISLDEEGRQ